MVRWLASPCRALQTAARRSRLAEDPAVAADTLATLQFVADDLELFPWPETIFLAQLERIVALHEGGQAEDARRAWRAFRKVWPERRAPESRVGKFAFDVEKALEGEPGARD